MRYSTHALRSSLLPRLTALLLAVAAVMTSWAYDFSVNGIYYNIKTTTGTAEVTYADNNYNSYSGRVVIPAQVRNDNKVYNVTAVGDNAFRNCSDLTAVVFGKNVTSIGKRALLGCPMLTIVNIAASITEIGDYAFAQCPALKTVAMLNNEPLEIGAGAFMKCGALTSVKWTSTDELDGHGGLMSLGTNAFAQCTSLTSIVLPGPLQHLGTTIFAGCNSLNSLTVMRDTPLSLKGDPFDLNPAQVTIKVPSSGVSGATAALYQNANGWKNYTIVELPYSFIDSNHYTYLKTSSSTVALNGRTTANDDVVVRKSLIGYNGENYNVTSIAPEAFKGKNIKTLDTGNAIKLKAIGSEAFAGCTQLTSVVLVDGIDEMGERAFAGCTSLPSVQVPSTLRYVPLGAFEGCSSLVDLNLLLGVSVIGENAFAHCSSLQNLFLPRSITEIDHYAFGDATSLVSVTVDTQCVQYASYEGVLFERKAGEEFSWREYREMNKLVLYPMCKTSEEFYIPCGVTKIEDNALQGATHLKHLAVPGTTKSFGTDCFTGAGIEVMNYRRNEPIEENVSGITTSLKAGTTLIVPVGATSAYQESTTWNGFKAIEERDYVFQDQKFFYDWNNRHQATIIDIKNAAVNSSGTLTIPSGVTMSNFSYSITELHNTCTAQVGSKVKNFVIANDSLSVIDTSNDINPLAAMPNLQSLTINDGNTHFIMNGGALYGTEDHELYYYLHSNTNQDFTLPDNTNAIMPQAFSGNIYLKNITFNNLLKRIGAGAFEGCTALEQVNNIKNVTSFGKRAFAQCAALTTLQGCEYVNTIGDEAFLNCAQLKFFPFNHSMLRIMGQHAFKGCSSLLGAVLGVTLNKVGDGAFEDCSSLEKVFFTSVIASMGNQMFKGCDALEELWLCNTSAPAVDADFFDPAAVPNIKLFVPQNSETSYRTTAPWSQISQVNTSSFLDNGADVNGDKAINALDITLIMSVLLGDEDSGEIFGHFDVNHDGSINAGDITLIYDYILTGAEVMMAYKFLDINDCTIVQKLSMSDPHQKVRAIKQSTNEYVTSGLLGYIDNSPVATITMGSLNGIPHVEIVPHSPGYCTLVVIVSDGSVCHYRAFPLIITP